MFAEPTLYANAGPHEEAFRLRGLPPRERATKAWARLRKHGVDPLLVVSVWLAVEMIVRDDIQGVDTVEFRRVQAAKIVHRLASGTHKRWAQGVGGANELHVYPASRGKVLRYIGKDVQGAAELLYENAKNVLRVTVTSAKAATRPAPRKLNVRRRSSPSLAKLTATHFACSIMIGSAGSLLAVEGALR
ncbi:hypothetical protein SAMN05443247_03918 [Bradyrhizobium erythrophlei]|nr:hypothetical protein SAMN05443247_03918 [Bradyrhizobium erythrophlei]